MLLAGWDSYAPAARGAVLNALLSRAEWVQSVLAAISAGRVAPVEVPLASRERLLKNKNPEIATRARQMFGGEPSGDRAQVLEQFKAAGNLTGDLARGSQVFEKLCSTCHALNGKGYAVGPDLASLRDKPADYLLLAILDPNEVVEPKFVSYEIETKSGRSLTGVIQSETGNGLTLVQAGGIKEQLLRSDLQQIKASARSLMPEGLEQGTTPQDFADLIEYLKSSGPARFGGATAQQAAAARADFFRAGGTTPSKVSFASENLNYGGWLGRAQMPHCRQTDGRSRVAWEMMPQIARGGTNASLSFRLPVAMGFISQPKGDFRLKVNGKEALNFDVSLNEHDWQSSDGKVRVHYVVMESNAEDSNGPMEIEVASSMIEPGQPVQFEVVASAANSQRWFGIYLLPAAQASASRQ
jgi:putative heme-binding domain-containing protein